MGYIFYPRQAPLSDKDTIVLGDFTNKTGDAVFDGTLRQGLAVQLQQSPFLSLISDQRIHSTLPLMNQPVDAPLTPDVAQGVCVRTGSVAVLEGSIAALWAARYLRMNGRRRLLGSFAHGSMANALPQAIGAQAALPDRQVISLSGDGGVAMLLGDLLTLKQLNLPVKVLVFNNNTLGFVELEMKAAGWLRYGTDLVNPDFAKLAESAGILGTRVEDPKDLQPALESAFTHDGPCLVDVVVNRQELSMPPTITSEQAVGFSLYMIRAVLSGRGDEVIDLAKTNLFSR